VRIKAGRYTLQDRVLDGDGWSYWCGHDGLLRRPVGLLVLDPGHPYADDVVTAARASAAVEDTRIQRVLDVLTDEEGTCLVIEWTAGSTVEELLAEGPLADIESWRVTFEVARALASTQARGLRHGALAPRWVLRGDGGRVRVLGLCVASALEGTGPDGPHPSDSGCDVRGLGELLYAALTARWPGDPSACSLPAAPMQGGRAVRPSRVRAGVPPALDDIAARALGLTTRGLPLEGATDVAAALESAGHRMRHFDASEPVDLDAEQLAQLVDTGYVERVTAELANDPRRAAAPARPRRRLALVGWVAGVTAAALVATGVWLVGRPAPLASSQPHSSDSSGPTGSAGASAEPTGAVVPIVSVTDFDPPPGNGTENPDQVRFAWDASLTTAWHTVTYFRRADLGGLKPGVGLLVDLGSQQTVGAVRLHLVGHGTSVELRAAVQPGTVADDFLPVAQIQDAGPVVTLRPVVVQHVRYLLIWLTRLPLAPDGVDYSGGIADIEVHRS
jgi:putative peptidoglycan lipid II flippase